MERRSRLYRCHLFSYGGPQTEGVVCQWTQNLEAIGERVALSGEVVEISVTVDGSAYTLDANTRVRFDILEQDHILTGGIDDQIVSIVGTDASAPSEGFTICNKTTQFHSLDTDLPLINFVNNFKSTYRDTYQDQILILEQQRDDVQSYLILTWWTAERIGDLRNSEFYFIINVDDQFDDKCEEILNVSPAETTEEEELSASSERLISGPDLNSIPLSELVFDIRWVTDHDGAIGFPGDTVRLEADYERAYSPNAPRFLILVDSLVGHQVATLEPELNDGLLQANWIVSLSRNLVLPARFILAYSDLDDIVLSNSRFEVHDILEAQILDENGEPLSHMPWRARLVEGNDIHEGFTDQNGRLRKENVLAGRYELEIDGCILISEEATRRSTITAEDVVAESEQRDFEHNVIYTFGESPRSITGIQTSQDPLVQTYERDE